jgi:hypothetical protein
MPYGSATVAPEWTKEQELGFLRDEAEAIKENLEQIESRIKNLGSEGES